MSKPKIKRIRIPWGWMGAIALAAPGWFWAAYQYFDSKPSAVVGFITPPVTNITVTLDNGAHSQMADPAIGFFRFDDVPTGLHAIRFEQDGFHPLSRNFQIASWGDNFLPRELELVPISAPVPTPTDEILLTVSTASSADGAEPIIPALAAAMEGVDAAFLDSTHSGWVYLGKRTGVDQYEGPFLNDPAVPVSALLEGSILRANSAFFLRDDKPSSVRYPRPSDPNTYALGDIVGIAQSGAEVRLNKVFDGVGDDAIWAQVTIIRDESNRK